LLFKQNGPTSAANENSVMKEATSQNQFGTIEPILTRQFM